MLIQIHSLLGEITFTLYTQTKDIDHLVTVVMNSWTQMYGHYDYTVHTFGKFPYVFL